MDKETLSNYGWIVICVLVLAVMIALATPFGSYISSAVKSTTQGLFDVNQSALNSTGLINIGDQSFTNGSNGGAGGSESGGSETISDKYWNSDTPEALQWVAQDTLYYSPTYSPTSTEDFLSIQHGQNGNMFKLLMDYDISGEELIIPSNVTLDLLGHALYVNKLTVYSGAKIVNGKIQINDSADVYGSVTMENVSLEGGGQYNIFGTSRYKDLHIGSNVVINGQSSFENVTFAGTVYIHTSSTPTFINCVLAGTTYVFTEEQLEEISNNSGVNITGNLLIC